MAKGAKGAEGAAGVWAQQRGDGRGKTGWTDLRLRLICFWRARLCGKGKAAPGSTAVYPSRFIDSLISRDQAVRFPARMSSTLLRCTVSRPLNGCASK